MIDHLPSTIRIVIFLLRLQHSKYKKIWILNPLKKQEDYVGNFPELIRENNFPSNLFPNKKELLNKRYLWKQLKKMEIMGILIHYPPKNKKYYYINKKIIRDIIDENKELCELFLKHLENKFFIINR